MVVQREKRAQKAKTPISIKAVNERVGNVGLPASKKVSLYGIVTKRWNRRIDIKGWDLMENLSYDYTFGVFTFDFQGIDN